MSTPAGSYATLADLGAVDTPGAGVSEDSSAVITQPSQIIFETQRVQPPTNLYVVTNDYLVVSWYSPETTATITVTGRLLEPDGSIKYFSVPIQVTAGDNGKSQTITLAEGFLLNVTLASLVSTIQRGLVFFTVVLQRGPLSAPTILQALLSTYVWTGSLAQWPGSPLIYPAEGPGAIQSLTLFPSQGADFAFNIPLQVRLRVISLRATLTTNATVGNRTIRLLIQDNVLFNLFAVESQNAQTASQAINYTWFPGGQRLAPVIVEAMQPIPDYTFLGPQFSLKSVTAGIQGTDQWTGVTMAVEKWIQL